MIQCTKERVIPDILETGFATLAQTDEGFFGQGTQEVFHFLSLSFS